MSYNDVKLEMALFAARLQVDRWDGWEIFSFVEAVQLERFSQLDLEWGDPLF